jgi:hypothetical protein
VAANLNDVAGWIKDIYYRLRKLESGSFLESSSITSGRMRFIGGTLMIDSGGQLVVIGAASVDGTMTINGTFLLTGSGWRIVGSGSIEGPTTVVGTLQIDGDTRITGNLSLEGDASLTGNMAVEDGGKILVGEMLLDPTEHGGAVIFPNGAQVFTDADTVQLYKGNSVAQISDSYARIQHGGDVVQIDGNGIRMSPGAMQTESGTGLPVGTVRVGADGYLRRSDGT